MAKSRFYAVVKGRKTGIFNCWDGGAREQVDGFKDAMHRSFATLELALEWYSRNCASGTLHSPVVHFSTEPVASVDTAEQAVLNLPDASAGDYVVYLIIDPLDGKPFYVGQTGDMVRRKAAHLRNAQHDQHKRVSRRMAEILARGDEPIFRVVQNCASEAESLSAESDWVKRCSQRGYQLCNRWREHRELQELFGAEQHSPFDD